MSKFNYKPLITLKKFNIYNFIFDSNQKHSTNFRAITDSDTYIIKAYMGFYLQKAR